MKYWSGYLQNVGIFRIFNFRDLRSGQFSTRPIITLWRFEKDGSCRRGRGEKHPRDAGWPRKGQLATSVITNSTGNSQRAAIHTTAQNFIQRWRRWEQADTETKISQPEKLTRIMGGLPRNTLPTGPRQKLVTNTATNAV